ncbi:hypothetical protein BJX68DRAFT_257396 [Aspergillus pseudodeflectus]|uniref:NADH:flavin oxidoreductase/NADH oxidase N-terminal domain-containing protein n=1 Tax=Aspergillus pseudodeflectus TaxID=176178 RepID=A0ABR4JU28_9EURO
MILRRRLNCRAIEFHVQLPIVPEYFTQRASIPGILLVSEATSIWKRAGGYPNKVTDAVHGKGSYLLFQLWALGRVTLPEVARLEGFDVVSSNPTPLDSDNPPPREGTEEEIQGFIQDYAQAARNALQAGFDGVEVHGAGGRLIDQFTKDNCNTRTDEYAGSIENRSRFIPEVVRAVSDVVGSNRVGIRLPPWQRYQGLRMEDPVPQFTHVIGKRKTLTLACLHLRSPSVLIDDSLNTDPIDPFIEAWGDCAPVILAGGFKPESAKLVLKDHFKKRDLLVAFGRYFFSSTEARVDAANDIFLEHDLNMERHLRL